MLIFILIKFDFSSSTAQRRVFFINSNCSASSLHQGWQGLGNINVMQWNIYHDEITYVEKSTFCFFCTECTIYPLTFSTHSSSSALLHIVVIKTIPTSATADFDDNTNPWKYSIKMQYQEHKFVLINSDWLPDNPMSFVFIFQWRI